MGLSLKNLFYKENNLDEITSFQESDPQRQKIYDNMTEDQKKKYIERKNRALSYIIKRQNFINVVVKEADKGLSDAKFIEMMNKISKVYGNTQMIDIFSTEHYFHLKSETVITPLFEMLEDCFNIDSEKLKEKIIDWLFQKTTKEQIRWEIVKGLIHCEYINYVTIDKLLNVINKYIEPITNDKLSPAVLEKLNTIIIPHGQAMAGQSYWSKWYSVARDLGEYKSIQNMLNVGFKIEFKAFGLDEILLNTKDGKFIHFKISEMINAIDNYLNEIKTQTDNECILLKEKRSSYKYSMVHKSFINFNEKDKELFEFNKVKIDVLDIEFFEHLLTRNFKNKKLLSILDEYLPDNTEITIGMKQVLPLLKKY